MTVTKRSKTDPEKFLLAAERFEESGDVKSAFKSLLAGALLGDSGCQANFGNFYASGKGTTKSLEKAAFWYSVRTEMEQAMLLQIWRLTADTQATSDPLCSGLKGRLHRRMVIPACYWQRYTQAGTLGRVMRKAYGPTRADGSEAAPDGSRLCGIDPQISE
jgi:TPR repeat protein